MRPEPGWEVAVLVWLFLLLIVVLLGGLILANGG